MNLKPQDLVVLVALVVQGDVPWTFESLGFRLGLSSSQVHRSLRRAAAASLYAPGPRRVLVRNLVEFLVHGVRYAFPAQRSPDGEGVPTGASAPPLSEHFVGGVPLVWPAEGAATRGEALEPLHPSAVRLSEVDQRAYEVLALVDAVRTGRARERKMAADLLEQRLAG